MSSGFAIPQVVTTNATSSEADKKIEDAEAEYLSRLRFDESEKQRLSIEKQKFDLEKNAENQRIAHEKNNHPFYRWGKLVVSGFALVYIAFLSFGLGYYVLTHKFLTASWHISAILISGAFLSIFGLFAILLRGMFQSEKTNDAMPLSLTEAIKAFIDAFKSIKSSN